MNTTRQTEHESNRRSKRLIDKRLQLRFVAAFACVAMVGLIVQSLMLTQQIVVLADRVPNDKEFVLASLPKILASSMLFTSLLVLPISLLVGIAFTFPVVGPIYRFKTHFQALCRGENPEPCTIRESDELHDLCDLINEFAHSAQPKGTDASEREPAVSKAA